MIGFWGQNEALEKIFEPQVVVNPIESDFIKLLFEKFIITPCQDEVSLTKLAKIISETGQDNLMVIASNPKIGTADFLSSKYKIPIVSLFLSDSAIALGYNKDNREKWLAFIEILRKKNPLVSTWIRSNNKTVEVIAMIIPLYREIAKLTDTVFMESLTLLLQDQNIETIPVSQMLEKQFRLTFPDSYKVSDTLYSKQETIQKRNNAMLNLIELCKVALGG